MKRSLLFAALLLVPLALTAADSTATTALQPGAKIRFLIDHIRHIGNLMALRGDSILVKDKSELPFRIADISHPDISTGRQNHILEGLAIGCGAGFIAGLIAGNAASQSMADDALLDEGNKTGLAIATGAATFVGCAALGTAIGAMIETDRWKPVQPWPPPR